jgi:hypothetical protein
LSVIHFIAILIFLLATTLLQVLSYSERFRGTLFLSHPGAKILHPGRGATEGMFAAKSGEREHYYDTVIKYSKTPRTKHKNMEK